MSKGWSGHDMWAKRRFDLTGTSAGEPQPADGDDYSYFSRRPQTPAAIPAQFVPPSAHQALCDQVARQERIVELLCRTVESLSARVSVLERQAEEWTGD